MAAPGAPVSLSRLENCAKRLALRSVLLLALIGQSYALAHDHSHADSQLDATSCLVCHSSAGMDDAITGSSWSPMVDCRFQTLTPAEPGWPGFDPCQIANSRAPPVT